MRLLSAGVMTNLIAYADESTRPQFHSLAAVLVPTQELRNLGRLTRSLHLPGQRQLHCNGERDARRRVIIGALAGFGGVRGLVYRAPRPVVRARDLCLRALIGDLADRGVDQLILDRVDEQQAVRDRATIHELIMKDGGSMRYRHAASWEHPGIQAADVVAWAYGAGGEWRRRILPIIDKATDLDC